MPKFLDGYYTLQAGPQALQTAALVRHQDRELFAQTIHKVFIHRDVATKKKKSRKTQTAIFPGRHIKKGRGEGVRCSRGGPALSIALPILPN